MASTEHKLEVKNAAQPDEVRPFADKGGMDVVHLGPGFAGLATFEPGWTWTSCVKPIAGTETCQVHHTGYVLSGRMRVVMDDGAEAEVGPGDFYVIPPGHTASVVGDEPCVQVAFDGVAEYARPR
jgi:hypothetical protein